MKRVVTSVTDGASKLKSKTPAKETKFINDLSKMQNAEIHRGMPKVAVQVDSTEVNLTAPALDLHVAAPSFAVSL